MALGQLQRTFAGSQYLQQLRLLPQSFSLSNSQLVKAAAGLWDKLHPSSSCVVQWLQILGESPAGWLLVLAAFWVLSQCVETGLLGAASLALSGLALLACIFTPAKSLKLTSVDGWIIAYGLTALVACGFSSVQPESLSGFFKVAVMLIAWLGFRSLFGRFPVLIGWTLGIWALSGGAQAVVAWQQLHSTSMEALATWQDPSLDASLQLTRVYGTLPPFNPNLLAGFLIPCLGASLGLWGWQLSEMKTTALVSWGRISVLTILTLLTAWALVATGSRGGYLALAAIGITFVAGSGHLIFRGEATPNTPILKRLWAWGIALVVLSVAALLLKSEKIMARLASIGAGADDSSIAYRFHVYQSAWRMIQDHWLTGIGPGNLTFEAVYGFYMAPGIFALGCYSVPLEVWVEHGIVGLIAFAGLWISTAMAGFWVIDTPGIKPEYRWWAVALLAIWVGQGVYGLFDTVWYRPAVQLTTWATVAAIAVLVSLTQQPANKGLAHD
ncbi:MAG: O-antigen ligase family protein [Vampirovibrionales bacterium]|nr:O-antigen ligase family protein [Vampirovibrionales bacterium]